jgi:hypothetical protein
MNAETIREWLDRRPCEAFVLALSNGESCSVKHPENVIVLKSRLILGCPEMDSAAHIGLIHVNSIQGR